MKKLILAGAVMACLFMGVTAYSEVKHPHLLAADEAATKAIAELDTAQKDNPKGDLGGHAKKAKELLAQARNEIQAAIDDANKEEGKKK